MSGFGGIVCKTRKCRVGKIFANVSSSPVSARDAFLKRIGRPPVKSVKVAALTPGAVDAIITAVARKTSPYSIVAWHHFHGAATRIAAERIAFGLRQDHFMVEIIACWEPDGSDGSAHRQWAQELWQSLAPFALPGGYANMLAPRDREQPSDAYGSDRARLRSLKPRFDPDGVASAIPLPDQH